MGGSREGQPRQGKGKAPRQAKETARKLVLRARGRMTKYVRSVCKDQIMEALLLGSALRGWKARGES